LPILKKEDAQMKLVIAEKPSVARSLARMISADKRCDGYLEGGGYLVSWCVGHLVELSAPERYNERFAQ
jgi:DNA topoisomerase-3